MQHKQKRRFLEQRRGGDFFETLKRELVDGCVYHRYEEASQAIFEYVKVYDNRKRQHSSQGYLTLLEAECQATAA